MYRVVLKRVIKHGGHWINGLVIKRLAVEKGRCRVYGLLSWGMLVMCDKPLWSNNDSVRSDDLGSTM